MATLAPISQPAPSSADRSPLERVRSLAAGVLNTTRLSGALVNAGRPVDLSGLDNVIGLLCAKALDLPPEQGRELLVELYTLRTEIDRLSAAIAQSNEETAHSPEETATDPN